MTAKNKQYFLSSSVLRQLNACQLREDSSEFGLLLSLGEDDYECRVVSCICSSECGEQSRLARALHCLPGGLHVCGMCVKLSDAASVSAVQKAVKQISVPTPKTCVVAAVGKGGAVHLNAREGSSLHPTQYTVLEESRLKQYLLFRLRASLPVSFEHPFDTVELEKAIKQEFHRLDRSVRRDTTAYSLSCFPPNSSEADSCVLLLGSGDVVCKTGSLALSEHAQCRELIEALDAPQAQANKKRRKAGDFTKDVVHVGLLVESSGPCAVAHTIAAAPVIHHEHRQFAETRLSLPLDAVVYMEVSDPLEELPQRLSCAIQRQLEAMCKCLLSTLSKEGKICTPEAFHFHPDGLDHILTVVYPKGVSDDLLEHERCCLHKVWGLSVNRPSLRRLQAVTWPDDVTMHGGLLLNVHEGLPPPKGTTGSPAVVQGRYTYHHYMQDRFNDDGWGCAYRSLQTLVSWFRLQGYTERPVPSHKIIQKTLVDIGDKPSSVIGSNTWIGSTEVSFVLESYLGVTSRILFVNSGAEVASKGRELAMHFRDQGTPVMIGGGVLAHTILGVDFDDVTGHIMFLILDPHYTGGEDLKIIQDKGWCGWKGASFWNTNAHYNMCLPQRPDMI